MITTSKQPRYGGFGDTIVDDIFMVFLSVVSVILLCIEVLATQTPAQQYTLFVFDILVCGAFLIEFGVRNLKAPCRKSFFKQNWWQLFAAIPVTTSVFHGSQLFNLIRIIQLIRLVRFAARIKVLLSLSAKFATDAHLIYAALVAALVVLAGALGFHYMEFGHNENVHSLWDSFWWTCVTITTVGYGDIYPATTGGRILAMFLMFGGIATFSTVTAMIAAKLLQEKPGEEQLTKKKVRKPSRQMLRSGVKSKYVKSKVKTVKTNSRRSKS